MPKEKNENDNEDVKEYKCSQCNKKYSQPGHLGAHKKIHKNEKSYPCTFCDKKFIQRSNLNSHLRTHTRAKPFICNYPECGKQFARSDTLKKHKVVHSAVQERRQPFACTFEDCEERFTQRQSLQRHIKSIHEVDDDDDTE
jgi:KRAB domain-containing zinc finger protein